MIDLSAHTHDERRMCSLIAQCLGGDVEGAVDTIERGGLWEYVASYACDAGLAGPFLQSLEQAGFEPPAAARLELQCYIEYVAASNAYKQSAVVKVLAWLEANGVDFMLLKGCALNATIYPEPGHRGMTDVDVLIHPEDARQIDDLLRGFGCEPGADLINDEYYPTYYHEREYFTPTSPRVKIDLHVRPFRPLRYVRTVPDEALWTDCDRVDFGPLRVRVPNAEAMLIHLAGHAACHGSKHLRWLHDIARWTQIYREKINPHRVAETAQDWGMVLAVREALLAVKRTLGDPTGRLAEILHALRGATSWSEKLALEHAPHDGERPVSSIAVNLLTTPGLSYRIGYLRSVLSAGEGHLGQIYPHRHTGWQLAAHLHRAGRCLTRRFVKSA